MNVDDIVKKYLVENGFDGLCYENECGCETHNLRPCDGLMGSCESGVKVSCEHCRLVLALFCGFGIYDQNPFDDENLCDMCGENDWVIVSRP